jgi:hypothetical protein
MKAFLNLPVFGFVEGPWMLAKRASEGQLFPGLSGHTIQLQVKVKKLFTFSTLETIHLLLPIL